MGRLKLFPKTFLYTIGIMTVIVILVHGLMYFLLPTFYTDLKREEVVTRATELMEMLQDTSEIDTITNAKEYALKYNVNITLLMNDREYQFKGFTPLGIYFDPTITRGMTTDYILKALLGPEDNITKPYQVILDTKVLKNKDNIPVTFNLMLSTQPIDEAKQVTFKLLPYSIAISIIISLLAAFVYSKLITRPIMNIVRVTKDMEQLKKGSHCIVDSKDEIGLLADNINSLYDTLWHTIESLEQKVNVISEVEKEKVEFLRAASHELKTPLTSLRILLENMKHNIGKYSDRDFYLARAEEMVEESTNMVQSILQASKLQTVSPEKDSEQLDVEEVLLETLASYKILAKAKDIQLDLQPWGTFFYEMNREALKKVFSNLLSNAINYTNEGKRVNVQITGKTVMIENECTPLPKAELAPIFKAFYRPDFSRNKRDGGTGLGLYIVGEILNKTNLSYSFTPSEIGMRFTIDFSNK